MRKHHRFKQADIAFNEIIVLNLDNTLHDAHHRVLTLLNSIYKPLSALQLALHILRGAAIPAGCLG